MFEYLFLDLDQTILDFDKAERIAVGNTFASLGLNPTDEVLDRYHVVNQLHWQMLERGELTRDQVIVGRFAALLREFGADIDPRECAKVYEKKLAIGHYFLPGALEALQKLSEKYKLYLASNGTASVQASRIASSGIAPYFEKIFVSQELGANKPSREFYQRAFAQIPDFDPAKALMVGDSLTSDIRGGMNAGIATCWVNPKHKPRNPEIRVDYEIEALSQLYDLLEAL